MSEGFKGVVTGIIIGFIITTFSWGFALKWGQYLPVPKHIERKK